MLPESRARKKKSLGDPVDIIPPKKIPLSKIKKEKGSDQKTVEAPIEPTKIEKTSIQTNNKITPSATTSISIKAILSDQKREKREKESKVERPKDPINYEQLCLFWNQFAYEMKDQGMETFYNALVKRKPKIISNEHYVIVVDNSIQIDYINHKLNDFIEFLRPKLNNFYLKISVEITNEKNDETKFLTGKEKFEYLASKNPHLHVLKSMFNLDIDF